MGIFDNKDDDRPSDQQVRSMRSYLQHRDWHRWQNRKDILKARGMWEADVERRWQETEAKHEKGRWD